MAATVATLRARFPQVSSVTAYPDAFLDAVLAESLTHMGPRWSEARKDYAQMWLTMHLISMAPPTGSIGPGVQSVSAGQASISYWAVSVVDKDSLLLTPYGREYARLMRLEGPAMSIVCYDG
jgi:hypothetical protein